jgi:hypothetical protein
MPEVTRDEAVRAAESVRKAAFEVNFETCKCSQCLMARYILQPPPSLEWCRTFVGKAHFAGYTAACAKSDFSKIDADIERFTAELASHFPAWRPIETAPKDGTKVLIFDGEVQLAAWLNNNSQRRGWKIRAWSSPDSWQDEQGGYSTYDNPTHWQPLPPAPTEPTRPI